VGELTPYLGPCNTTRYDIWASQTYEGPLLDETRFWIFSNAPLNQARAMEQASKHCRRRLEQLRLDRAGRHGPVQDKYIYDQMCSTECIGSDAIRREALEYSGCGCLDLSTPESHPSFTIEGDWCRANTGRLLCEVFGQCGVWNCALGDFMCPRFEYNKYAVLHRGPGSCISGAGKLEGALSALALIAILLMSLHSLSLLSF
jgi:hypothetical protein